MEHSSVISAQRLIGPLAFLPGEVARSEANSHGMQAAPSSITTSGTFFRGDLVMKNISTAVLPLPLIQEEQLSEWPRPKWPKMCWRAVKQKSNQNQTLAFLNVIYQHVHRMLKSRHTCTKDWCAQSWSMVVQFRTPQVYFFKRNLRRYNRKWQLDL